MSEILNNSEERIKNLLELFTGIIKRENVIELIEANKIAIENVTPHDMLVLTDFQLSNNVSTDDIKKNVDKVMNLLYESLVKYNWIKPEKDTFLFSLMEENKALKGKLENIKQIMIKDELAQYRSQFLECFIELLEVDSHYVKKENILFPYLEKKLEKHKSLSVMWSLHDDVRRNLKFVIGMLEDEDINEVEFKVIIGRIFFLMLGMIQKEELILLPVATEILTSEEFHSMFVQSFEYEFAFINTPPQPSLDEENKTKQLFADSSGEYIIKSDTGEMTAEQTLLVLNKLPLDITFVDENDRVRFFSKPDERFFPRSPAIIGREVKNCHPPESVHIVEEIVKAFKKGEKESATFWINIKGKFILIQYFALRNTKGEYKGVIETSQDVTEIRSLEGEQRLLDWTK